MLSDPSGWGMSRSAIDLLMGNGSLFIVRCYPEALPAGPPTGHQGQVTLQQALIWSQPRSG